jgi:hypothetical protein
MTKKIPLGEILLATEKEYKTNQAFKMEQDLKEKDEKYKEKIKKVTDFFEEIKENFTQKIMRGEYPIKPISMRNENNINTILETYQWNDPRKTIENTTHPYHAIWADFSKWCTENKLTPKLTYEHDGMGIESWHTISISPLKPTLKRTPTDYEISQSLRFKTTPRKPR